MAFLTADRVQVGASLAEHPFMKHAHALEHAVQHATRHATRHVHVTHCASHQAESTVPWLYLPWLYLLGRVFYGAVAVLTMAILTMAILTRWSLRCRRYGRGIVPAPAPTRRASSGARRPTLTLTPNPTPTPNANPTPTPNPTQVHGDLPPEEGSEHGHAAGQPLRHQPVRTHRRMAKGPWTHGPDRRALARSRPRGPSAASAANPLGQRCPSFWDRE